jgi:voltage-gated potassium channel
MEAWMSKVTLKRIVEESDSRTGWLFDVTVQVLVLLSLVSFSLETLPDLPDYIRRTLNWTETIIVTLFTVEYALRLAVADRRLSFVFSVFGLVDLIAIMPFYLSLGIDLRSIRVVRFLRIFQILKLTRYSQAIQRFHRALAMVKEELILFGAAALVLLYVSAVGVYFFEREAQPEQFASIFHSLWWAIVTLSTVGYGDIYPITFGGRVFTFFVLSVGLGIIAVPTGLLASALSQTRKMGSNTNERVEPAA